jgi:hypothetical protein
MTWLDDARCARSARYAQGALEVGHGHIRLIRLDVEQCVRPFRMILGSTVHELFVGWTDPEHRMVEARRESREKILRACPIRDLDDHSESSEIPISMALIGVVRLVILGELPHYGRLAILVVADLRAFNFQEEMVGVPALDLRIGNGKICIRVDAPFEVRL